MTARLKGGIRRASMNLVSFKYRDWQHLKLAADCIAHLVRNKNPRDALYWSCRTIEIELERAGQMRFWSHLNIPLKYLLELFPRTFEIFGRSFVRLYRPGVYIVLDTAEEVMTRALWMREKGMPISSEFKSDQNLSSLPTIEHAVSVKREPHAESLLKMKDVKKKFPRKP